jgi:hypothetical protein
MDMIIIHPIGTDGGYWYIDDDGNFHHVGGWQPDQLTEFNSAVSIMGAAVHLKTPGLAEAAIRSVHSLVKTQLAEHLKNGGVVVVLP